MSFRMTRPMVIALCALSLAVSSGLAQNAPAPQGQAGAAGPQGAARGPAMPRFAGMPRIKALMVAGGCCHDYPVQGSIMMKLLQNELPIDWHFAYLNWGANRDVPTFYEDPKWYEGYDVIVHNDCFTPPDSLVSDRYIANVGAANRSGIPSVVIHCAMHTFRDEKGDQWRSVLGVHSMRHGPAHNIAVKIVAPQHPVMAGIRADWVTPVDELYVFERVFPGVVPLASGVDPADGREHAVAWVHQNNGARVFGTTLGHGMDPWNDPVSQTLLAQGFRWAVGR